MNKSSEEGFDLGCVERVCLGVSWREVAHETGAPLPLQNTLKLWSLSCPEFDLVGLVGLLFTAKCGFGSRLCPVGLSAGATGAGRSHSALGRSKQC